MASEVVVEPVQEIEAMGQDEFVFELVGESDGLEAYMGSGYCSCSCPDEVGVG